MKSDPIASVSENPGSRADLEPHPNGMTLKGKFPISRCFVRSLLLALVATVAAHAGPGVIGMVAGSTGATLGGEVILPNTTIFTGDILQVNQGLAVVALETKSRMVFGRDTAASFRRDSDGVTVLLRLGNVSLFHAENTFPVRVRVGDVSVIPASGFDTLAKVSADTNEVTVTSEAGKLRVEANGRVIDLAKGETIKVPAKATTPQSSGEPKVFAHSLLPSQTEPFAPSMEIPGTAPSGALMSIPQNGPTPEGNAEADASRTAQAAPVQANHAPAQASATTSEVGKVLIGAIVKSPASSPHNP